MWQNIIFVGLGSIVGGVSRYFISEWSRHLFPSSFPWGTFIVNIAGCFLLGLLSGFFTSHPAPVYRLFFTVGSVVVLLPFPPSHSKICNY